ncbi:uracil-DNA glycosylase [Ameyamaea chiangmaiensis NBRC 103196]|uniref:Uracil-DNA glycosylase family protein n=1 Tax=Ameyamaea chiangmaiensis TaxID=442969 RepID=A0A850PGL7_9PROT|nr:uracil-DNA glycosylase family protein [Ameyamaea chiangmaiensis]MBS4074341.1 uracil-DNA glycosylase family protein [Ameyamaea chiangmaiensis]NVN40311.1 uracil-DNA glycosylase family protein [Ameyamaea chiangmaiensis]GBQ71702.1 uracil-DNA glycosylase [Ameyamaea chiangmaiensis NBRC 103196]
MSPDGAAPPCAPTLSDLLGEVRGCRACADLPLGPRPLVHAAADSRILIASQAPGTKAHLSGRSFDDASGIRLRDWMGIDEATFWDTRLVAIMPMGLCYPGRLPKGGDCPPRPNCAPLWRARVLALMPSIELTLLVGAYSQAHVLGPGPVGERALDFRAYLPRYFPLPHPSWRTGAWEARTPRFRAEVIPALRAHVRAIIERARG